MKEDYSTNLKKNQNYRHSTAIIFQKFLRTGYRFNSIWNAVEIHGITVSACIYTLIESLMEAKD